MSFTRAAGLGCVLLLSPALCFSAYAEEEIDPYLIGWTVDQDNGTATASGQTSAKAVPAPTDGRDLYGNIYGAIAQARGTTTELDNVEGIHTTDASHNNITFNGFLKSYYLIGAITEPSAYDSTGNTKATSDYNTVQIAGADNYRSFGAVAFIGVNEGSGDDHQDGDDHPGDSGDQGGNTDPDRYAPEDHDRDGDGSDGSEGSDRHDGVDGKDTDAQTISLTNALSSSANALNDTAAIVAVSDTADQTTHTMTLSASHNTFDITGGSQSVVAGGFVAVGEEMETNGSSIYVSASADDNTLTLHGGTYNYNFPNQ